MNFNLNEIYDTVKMSEEERFDIRTTTMGINLLPCVDSKLPRFLDKIEERITDKARSLKTAADEAAKEFGIPIINKRITITPVSLLIANHLSGEADHDLRVCLQVARRLDETAQKLGIDFIGGFGGFVELGRTQADWAILEALPHVLSQTNSVCSFVNAGTSRQGINMNVVKYLGSLIKEIAETSENALGCAKFVVFCNAVPDSPFMAGGFYGIQNGEASLHVGLSGPGVVANHLRNLPKEMKLNDLANEIKKVSFKLVRAGELIGKTLARRLNVDFGSVDLSLAPTTAVGDSVGEVLELIGVEKVGTHGSTAALALLTDAVKKGGLAASANIGGFSGAFIPVSEDRFLSQRAQENILTLDKLEAMTTVCSVGLDMVAIPGDTPAETISGIIADEMAIGLMNNKTTATRLIPAMGKQAGDYIEFGGLLGGAYVIPVHNQAPSTFIQRSGRIPAALTSFRN